MTWIGIRQPVDDGQKLSDSAGLLGPPPFKGGDRQRQATSAPPPYSGRCSAAHNDTCFSAGIRATPAGASA